jgi:hypothetical protein
MRLLNFCNLEQRLNHNVTKFTSELILLDQTVKIYLEIKRRIRHKEMLW